MKKVNFFDVFVALGVTCLATSFAVKGYPTPTHPQYIQTLSTFEDYDTMMSEDNSGDGEPMPDEGPTFCCRSKYFHISCIPYHRLCDGFIDCLDSSDEANCERGGTTQAPDQIQNISQIDGVLEARKNLTEWILKRRSSGGYGSDKWSRHVPRIASALYFADRSFFKVANHTGDELRYETTIQALRKLAEMDKFSTSELALYVNAMIVTCLNPRDFHGFDLVAELRRRVDKKAFINPMEILVLCNAGDTMTSKDVERVYLVNETDGDQRNHCSWRELRAIAVLTMSCIRRHSNVAANMDESIMIPDLIRGQAANGSVGNVKTDALVLQALIASGNLNVKDFNFRAAVQSILRSQSGDGSFGSMLNSYYVLPVLNHKSLMDISTDHCRQDNRTDKQKIYDSWMKKDRKLSIRLSVVNGKESEVKNAWTLNVPLSSSFYEVMEVVSLIDPKLEIDYSIFEGKPYVSSVFGVQNDPELGLCWFTFVKNFNSSMGDQEVKQSPVDFKVESSQELILWYKEGSWREVENPEVSSVDLNEV